MTHSNDSFMFTCNVSVHINAEFFFVITHTSHVKNLRMTSEPNVIFLLGPTFHFQSNLTPQSTLNIISIASITSARRSDWPWRRPSD